LQRVFPGHFFLVSCMNKNKMKETFQPYYKDRDIPSILTSIRKGNNEVAHPPFLKRPFGIHRTFFTEAGFERDYLRYMRLPMPLSRALHTTFPDTIQIFYKRRGVGTSFMGRLSPGDKINVIGPLGSPIDINKLLTHYDSFLLIGGGTGMAPLIFLVQAFRYYNMKVTAFIGIDSFKNLKHRDPHARSYTESTESVYIYVDDLKEVGLDKEEIYVSIEEGDTDEVAKLSGIPTSNVFKGFVSKQFELYISGAPTAERSCVIACGPKAMLEAIYKTTKERRINLKVFLERPMACGVGVCLSCVLEMRDPTGNRTYKKVCTDGPIFDANEVIWNSD
ncbi:MAG: hypothetical protein AB1798_13720, partial [Spirochaetota bacterium]